MRIASLGSGSRGNATLVRAGSQLLLVDSGFSVREIERRLARFGLRPSDITAVLVTHEHGDHVSGVAPLARKFDLPVYATPGTADKGRLGDLRGYRAINCHQSFYIAEVEIVPVPVPHDAREPCQYIITEGCTRFGILTDLGHVTHHVRKMYDACQCLMLEFNHDITMLQEGPYPYPLKRRVGGDHGHLNNQQAIDLLESLDLAQLDHLVIAHISEQNNETAIVTSMLEEILAEWPGNLVVATQDDGFDWLETGPPGA